jgi:hypothetical protein
MENGITGISSIPPSRERSIDPRLARRIADTNGSNNRTLTRDKKNEKGVGGRFGTGLPRLEQSETSSVSDSFPQQAGIFGIRLVTS